MSTSTPNSSASARRVDRDDRVPGTPGTARHCMVAAIARLPRDRTASESARSASEMYEHSVQPSDPAHFQWRTDIGFT